MVIASLDPLDESSIEAKISHVMIDAGDGSKLLCTPEDARFA